MTDIILIYDAWFTIVSIGVLMAIIGGPMRFMKWSYKLFMFFIMVSLLGASLDKIVRLVSYTEDSAIVVLIAKNLIAWSRLGMIAMGFYILINWKEKCNKIKTMIVEKQMKDRGRALQHIGY